MLPRTSELARRKILTPEDKRRNFAQSAAHASWYDLDGNIIAEGKTDRS